MGLFDVSFTGGAKTALDARKKFVSERNIKWNYQKFAYISMKATGESTTVFCSDAGNQVGDPGPRGGHIGLYTNEGGIRRFKPQLKSVKIVNQGSQDYADSFIYEIEASFTVYTLADLTSFDKSYFRIGAEVQFDFGWEGQTGSGNSGTVKANVYNYDFSMAEDGSFECNIKCISAAGLWASDDMGGVVKDTNADDEADSDPQAAFIQDLKKGFRRAFQIDRDEGPESVDDIGNNKLVFNFNSQEYDPRACFFAAEIVVAPGFFNDDEVYYSYTTVDTFIKYLNWKAGTSALYKYEISSNAELSTWPKVECIGCADPGKFVLPGNQGAYGDPADDGWFDGDIAPNFAEWGDIVSAATSAAGISSDIGKILVSIEHLNQVYLDLSNKAPTKNGIKQTPKVVDFAKAVFQPLEHLTGGLISLQFIPLDSSGNMLSAEQQISTSSKITLSLSNKKMVSNPTSAKATTPYKFSVVGKDSITRSISLSSDFDSDLMISATQQNIEKGTSNMAIVENSGFSICAGDLKPGGDEAPTAADILKTRLAYGNNGFDQGKIQSYAEMCKNYILQKAKTDFSAGRYSEAQFVLNLTVTLDGVWDVPYMAPITVDRLPAVYSGDNVIFSIIGVEHTFDGQGDWETSIETVMRLL